MARTDVVQVHFEMPRSWRDELVEVADQHGLSFAALMRLVARNFLRNRYSVEQREALR